jgi:hypothetical protein
MDAGPMAHFLAIGVSLADECVAARLGPWELEPVPSKNRNKNGFRLTNGGLAAIVECLFYFKCERLEPF